MVEQDRERRLLEFLRSSIDLKGEPPTISAMKKALGITSTAGMYRLLDSLEERGHIVRERKSWKGIKVARKSYSDEEATEEAVARLPLLGIVAAGNPIEAVLVPETIDVPVTMIRPGIRHFALEVRGESMIGENIIDGDKIILRHSTTAQNGDLVVALVDGCDATVKTFRKDGDTVNLEPANSRFETISVAATRVTIQGIVVGLIRKYRND
jgi:repressor LexA